MLKRAHRQKQSVTHRVAQLLVWFAASRRKVRKSQDMGPAHGRLGRRCPCAPLIGRPCSSAGSVSSHITQPCFDELARVGDSRRTHASRCLDQKPTHGEGRLASALGMSAAGGDLDGPETAPWVRIVRSRVERMALAKQVDQQPFEIVSCWEAQT